jgi:hypothetical protein
MNADSSKTPCYTLTAGLELHVGFRVTIPIPGYGSVDVTNVDFPIKLGEKQVGSGQCEIPPGASSLPPGAGPDASHYANPKFTPWSIYQASQNDVPADDQSVDWTNVQQSIDGNYLLSESATESLAKVDGTGKVLWSNRYSDDNPPAEISNWSDGSLAIYPKVVVSTLDTNLMVLGEQQYLVKIGQGGGLYWGKRLIAAADTEPGPYGYANIRHAFTDALVDGDKIRILGTHASEGHVENQGALLLQIDQDGNWVSGKKITSLDSELFPIKMIPYEDDLVVAGLDYLEKPSFRLFLARLHKDGSVVWARRYVTCRTSSLQPYALIKLRSSGFAIGGRDDRSGLVAAFDKDGNSMWASVIDDGTALSNMNVHSIAELPTTGFVVGESYAYRWDPERIALAGLDAMGRPLWTHSYEPIVGGTVFSSRMPSILLTDDGGMLVHGYASNNGDGGRFAMKVPAKDGQIALASTDGEMGDVSQVWASCVPTESAITLTVSDFDAKLVDRDITVKATH